MSWRRALVWLIERRNRTKTLVIRVGTFYAGYRVLHHEVYEASTSEPLLIFLGLWLCGIAPATFFDQLRRLGVSLQSELDKQTKEGLLPEGDPKDEPEDEPGEGP